MFARLKRTVAVFAATSAAFLAYHAAAVPFIEPEFVDRPSREARPIQTDPPRNRTAVLRPYFAAGSWPLDNPIMLESDQSKLLFKEYHNLDNGRVKLFPCAFIFFPSGDLTRDTPQRVIVLDAPQGAVLQFDGPVDLQSMKLGQLQGGEMKGPVTIHGTPSRAGANDEIFFETRDVVMSTDEIATEAPVDFRFGPSTGHGRRLVIHLKRSAAGATGQRGPNVGGIDSLELLQEVQMRLVPGASGIMPLDGQRQGDVPRPVGEVAVPVQPQPPVDVRCRGPFRFDFAQSIATFQDKVNVSRDFDNGLRDWLNCQRLSIFFAPKVEPATTTGGSTPAAPNQPPAGPSSRQSQNLEPRRIEASGTPVILQAESNGVFARVEHLAYDIEPGHLGRLDSEGPGWLRATPNRSKIQAAGNLAARPAAQAGVTQLGLPVAPSHIGAAPQVFEARWSEYLRMRPYEQEHVISLKGAARAALTGEGELSGDEIHLWVKEVPSSANVNGASGPIGRSPTEANPPRSQIIPDRLLAEGHVQINSPQVSGTTTLLRAWFEQAAPAVAAGSGAGRGGEAPLTGPSSPVGVFNMAPASPITQASAGAPLRHYQVEGQRIDLQLLMGARGTEVEGVTIDGQARFGESQAPQPGELPLLIAGQQIQVLRANAPDTAVTVSGKPAEVGSRGMVLRGDLVRLDKKKNLLWIDGPGQMTLPMNQSLTANLWPVAGETSGTAALGAGHPANTARPDAPADPLYITWKDLMTFDGTVAHFEHSIVGQSATRQFRTDTLDVSLRRRIDFSQPRTDERAEIDGIIMHENFWLENRGFDPRDPKKLIAIDRMQARNLAIYESTGEIIGEGPGVLTSVRLDSPDSARSTGTQTRAGSTATSAAASRSGQRPSGFGPLSAGRNGESIKRGPLNYLNVRFDGPVSGNLNRHEVTLHDHVRSIYGPVAAWEQQLNSDELGPDDWLMNCNLLTVRQMNPNPSAADPQHRPIELEAEGNTEIEGDVFTAHAHRMTYTEAKDVLMLEGDGRNLAELYRQDRPGAESGHTQARQILYFRSTEQVSVNGAGPSDFNLGPAPPRAKKPAQQTGVQSPAGGAK